MAVLRVLSVSVFQLFFFNAPAPTEIYTLSLHDALPICRPGDGCDRRLREVLERPERVLASTHLVRSEEHTSELQSRQYLVCRLLLEKKKRSYPPYPSCAGTSTYLLYPTFITVSAFSNPT